MNAVLALSDGKRRDKGEFLGIAKRLVMLGFGIYATEGTRRFLEENGIRADEVPKIRDDPMIINMIQQKKISLIINIPSGRKTGSDGFRIRREAYESETPICTTLEAAQASVDAIAHLRHNRLRVDSLQEYFRNDRKG